MAKTNTKSGTASSSASSSPTAGLLMLKRLCWMVMAGLWVLLAASLASFSPADWPSHAAAPQVDPPANWCGRFGAVAAYELYLMFGQGVWILMTGAMAYLLATAAGRAVQQLALRTIGLFIMAVSVSGFVAVLAPNAGVLPEGSGGLLAIAAIDQLIARFNTLGTLVIVGMCFGVGATLAVDELVLSLPRGLAAAWRRIGEWDWRKPATAGGWLFGWMRRGGAAVLARAGTGSGGVSAAATADQAKPHRPIHGRGRKTVDLEEAIDESAGGVGGTKSFDPDKHRRGAVTAKAEDEADEPPAPAEPVAAAIEPPPTDDAEVAEQAAEPEEVETESADAAARRDAIRAKLSKLPITFAGMPRPTAPLAPPKQDLSGYRFPTPDMLAEPESDFTEEMARIVREQAEVLEGAMQMYRIDAEVVAIDAGPVITLYEVQLAPGTKVAVLNKVASDIARELKAQNIRIVPNTAGKSTVGVEVPNLKKEKVRLKELMELGGAQVRDKMRLPMYLGKDASGNPLIADLARMPHMLIAGTTGSGKSVCINSIIMSFLLTRRPDELKLILVDPKMVEMAQFRDIPHLMCPVVTEMNKAAAILEWAVTKMDERYSLLSEAGVRDLDSYNRMTWKELAERFDPQTPEEEAAIPRKLPRIVFVIDELADLMITNKEVEGFIVRIAQKARAVGIHLILATQRPQANVVTGLIKSNMPARISFQVASGMDSRIVLDSKGAELLLGQGDMLYMSPGTSKLTRCQGTFVDDVEVRNVVRFLKGVAEQVFEPQLIQLKAPDAADASVVQDELFDQSVRVVLETKRGSVSLLQRKLGIGYSRASKIIEQMEEFGILGGHKTAQARECLISIEDWEAMRAHAMHVSAEQGVDPTLYQPAAGAVDEAAEMDAQEDVLAGEATESAAAVEDEAEAEAEKSVVEEDAEEELVYEEDEYEEYDGDEEAESDDPEARLKAMAGEDEYEDYEDEEEGEK